MGVKVKLLAFKLCWYWSIKVQKRKRRGKREGKEEREERMFLMNI